MKIILLIFILNLLFFSPSIAEEVSKKKYGSWTVIESVDEFNGKREITATTVSKNKCLAGEKSLWFSWC